MCVCACVQLLEQAMRTYPGGGADRWVKVSEAVGSRSKEECIARVKVRSRCHELSVWKLRSYRLVRGD